MFIGIGIVFFILIFLFFPDGGTSSTLNKGMSVQKTYIPVFMALSNIVR